jgi:hypothetical protein
MKFKPLGKSNYGSIPHLPGSRVGEGDHHCHEGQEVIACIRARDKWDRIIVQEKLDGSNVGVARVGYEIIPLTRAGYAADTSPYHQHQVFDRWVKRNSDRFMDVLLDGERLCGEWLLVAHGTKYRMHHECFVAFDIIGDGNKRVPYDDFKYRAGLGGFVTPHVVHDGGPIPIGSVMDILGEHGFHGAQEAVEGAVWRVERMALNDKNLGNVGGRHPVVDFLVKFVRHDKVDGKYLIDGGAVYNDNIEMDWVGM